MEIVATKFDMEVIPKTTRKYQIRGRKDISKDMSLLVKKLKAAKSQDIFLI